MADESPVVDDFDDETPEPTPAPAPKVDDRDTELEAMRAALRKANKEAETLRRSQMTDNEKAVNAARDEGRAAALAEAGSRLVAAEFRAAAAGRDINVKALLSGLNLPAFLADDGEADVDRIVKYVDTIAPAKTDRPPPGRGGPRSTGDRPNDMNALLRRRAGASSE